MAEEKPTEEVAADEGFKNEGSQKFNFRDSMIGSRDKYNYAALCMPNIPFCSKPDQQVNFYGKGTTSYWRNSIVLAFQRL